MASLVALARFQFSRGQGFWVRCIKVFNHCENSASENIGYTLKTIVARAGHGPDDNYRARFFFA